MLSGRAAVDAEGSSSGMGASSGRVMVEGSEENKPADEPNVVKQQGR